MPIVKKKEMSMPCNGFCSVCGVPLDCDHMEGDTCYMCMADRKSELDDCPLDSVLDPEWDDDGLVPDIKYVRG
jgi:hypothetical protein